MTPLLFESLLRELMDENPFAIRAALRILKVQYTDDIPTLAVTCHAQPRLLVNLAFLGKHAKTESQVKAVVAHEFLHVLLRHTEGRQPLSYARHIAFDAVINAIIHRQYGESYSSMMANYYASATGLQKLLRPMNAEELAWCEKMPDNIPQWAHAWQALYAGKLVTDDIEELAQTVAKETLTPNGEKDYGPFNLDSQDKGETPLLGNHDDLGQELEGDMAKAVEEALKQMNGHGIWRSPQERNIGGAIASTLFKENDTALRKWEVKTLALIKQHITPDKNTRAQKEQAWSYRIPVLHPGDRRAFLKSQWSPFLPESTWVGQRLAPDGTAQVYLDVSGSMHQEMPAIIHLLNRLGRYIRRPFWAFSDVVAPALIEKGQLRTSTTGGTSMRCVLEHVAKTSPSAAIVITDGYIEAITKTQAAKAQSCKLHILVTRSGNSMHIASAGLPYTQLDKVPA